MFKNKYKPPTQPVKKSFTLNNDDFPEMVSSNNNIKEGQEVPIGAKLDFKNCYKPEDVSLLKNDRKPGWVYASYDKTTHTTSFEDDKGEVVEITKPPDDSFRSVEEIMAESSYKWEKYKEEYIELFGYDEYAKMFMPECLNYDQEEEDEVEGEDYEYVEDAEEYTEEYGDLYDDMYYEK